MTGRNQQPQPIWNIRSQQMRGSSPANSLSGEANCRLAAQADSLRCIYGQQRRISWTFGRGIFTLKVLCLPSHMPT